MNTPLRMGLAALKGLADPSDGKPCLFCDSKKSHKPGCSLQSIIGKMELEIERVEEVEKGEAPLPFSGLQVVKKGGQSYAPLFSENECFDIVNG